ncbi:hypothetical protein COX86_02235 [Candidatus Micrarchaeota archaeon CG_4_10_14_0_2_um_filter_60_11]|nr:MAG: hypothetical protein COU39_01940 [Candidatus Micrarchaeota archaeon CG10_big_fil_rev_8_21_14_0_10_60_32]PIO01945.1 MAG: hypothetical protein COT58_02345 [Candidatus Micrarchaeota archaeon CG09_land_8_20_14_0_10_60_16]PIZ90939.1 MAG: hypothetical protein COX86_02235 [Candidatus Micrarchaeota archaeon CG_4_10_14_0_2_um_filter_60_11]
MPDLDAINAQGGRLTFERMDALWRGLSEESKRGLLRLVQPWRPFFGKRRDVGNLSTSQLDERWSGLKPEDKRFLVRDLFKSKWNRRSRTVESRPFRTIELGGHKVEHRVCADAGVDAPQDEAAVTLISASGLEMTRAGIGRLPFLRSKVVVNDSMQGYTPRLYLYSRLYRLHESVGEANRALAGHALKLRFFDARPASR